MVAATERELHAAGVAEAPEVVLADAGYWHQAQMEDIVTRGIQVLVPPDANKRKGAAQAGTVAITHSCAACWRPIAEPASMANAGP
jgi:hypothetical protein